MWEGLRQDGGKGKDGRVTRQWDSFIVFYTYGYMYDECNKGILFSLNHIDRYKTANVFF